MSIYTALDKSLDLYRNAFPDVNQDVAIGTLEEIRKHIAEGKADEIARDANGVIEQIIELIKHA